MQRVCYKIIFPMRSPLNVLGTRLLLLDHMNNFSQFHAITVTLLINQLAEGEPFLCHPVLTSVVWLPNVVIF